jgi:hypothetical protein
MANQLNLLRKTHVVSPAVLGSKHSKPILCPRKKQNNEAFHCISLCASVTMPGLVAFSLNDNPLPHRAVSQPQQRHVPK